jgi:hypothetical protein
MTTVALLEEEIMALAVHPLDRFFSIGGTQDNGTEFLKPNFTFTRADFGDGGYSLIDQNATDNTNVTMYHTYFNQTNSLIGSARNLTVPCAVEVLGKPERSLRGLSNAAGSLWPADFQ